MSDATLALLLGLGALTTVIVIVVVALSRGRGDLRYFETHSIAEFRRDVAFIDLASADYDFFALHPIAEWSRTELLLLNEAKTSVGRYLRPAIGLWMNFELNGQAYVVRFPKYEVGTKLLDERETLLATAARESMGSDGIRVDFADGSRLHARPPKPETASIFKAPRMNWLDASGHIVARTLHVSGKRASNVYVFALRKDITPMQRLAVFAYFAS